jgi:hypothetical protein
VSAFAAIVALGGKRLQDFGHLINTASRPRKRLMHQREHLAVSGRVSKERILEAVREPAFKKARRGALQRHVQDFV